MKKKLLILKLKATERIESSFRELDILIDDYGVLVVVLVAIFSFGVGGYFQMNSEANLGGLFFRNIVWVPMGVFINVVILERVLKRVSSQREKRKYARFIKVDSLEHKLKAELVAFAFPTINNDIDIDDLYLRLVRGPEALITDEFIASTRKVAKIINGQIFPEEYNFVGFLMLHFGVIRAILQEHLDHYAPIMDEELFLKIDSLKKRISEVGMLDIVFEGKAYVKLDDGWTRVVYADDTVSLSCCYSDNNLDEESRLNLIEAIHEIDSVIKELKKYKEIL